MTMSLDTLTVRSSTGRIYSEIEEREGKLFLGEQEVEVGDEVYHCEICHRILGEVIDWEKPDLPKPRTIIRAMVNCLSEDDEDVLNKNGFIVKDFEVYSLRVGLSNSNSYTQPLEHVAIGKFLFCNYSPKPYSDSKSL